MEALLNHPWPGNVRELENLVQRLAALYSEEIISEAIVNRFCHLIEQTSAIFTVSIAVFETN